MLRKLLSLIAIGLMGLTASAHADSKVRVVRLSHIEGDVQIDRGDGQGFHHAFVNMPVIDGARVWTRDNGRAEIEFEDGSTLRLAPESIVTFTELSLRDRGGRVSLLDIQEGTAYFNIRRDDDDDFRVTFGQQQIMLDKSSRFRLELRKEDMRLAVFRGELHFLRHNGQRVEIRKNETLSIDFSDPERYYLGKGITEEAHDYWDRQREEDRIRYLADQRERRYDDRYAYGYYDLYRHGSFYHHHHHGWIWRPFHVSLHWDPFGFGSWLWYPRHGYVWVSPYPWGWTPYHHGSWIFVHGRGWCWRGGGPRVFNHFVTVTKVHYAPRGYRPPRVPTVVAHQPPVPIVNVGRGAGPHANPRFGSQAPELPRQTGQGVVASRERGAGSRGDLAREARSGRVIDNDTMERTRPERPATSAQTGQSVATRTEVDRPTPAGRNADVRADAGADRAARSPRVADPDYENVDYRARRDGSERDAPNVSTRATADVVRPEPRSAATPAERPTRSDVPRLDVGGDSPRMDREDHGNRPVRVTPMPAPRPTYDPSPAQSAPSPRPADSPRMDRGDSGNRPVRVTPMPAPRPTYDPSPARSAPAPRPNPPPSMSSPSPQRSAPPPAAARSAGRESRSARTNPN
jgi:hypothetical protein